MRFDAGGIGVSMECGQGTVGMVALADDDADGPVDHRPLLNTGKPRSCGGRRKVGVQHDQPIPVAATRSMPPVIAVLVIDVVPVAVTVAVAVLPVAVSVGVVGGPLGRSGPRRVRAREAPRPPR